MIHGQVNSRGLPTITTHINGHPWETIIDTGFNGELEMPESLYSTTSPLFNGRIGVHLGSGQYIMEDTFLIDFPFDGDMIAAETTFADTAEILIGTRLIKDYLLEVNFPDRTVRLEKRTNP